GQATVATRTELRRRSLFKVPVYQADIGFAAHCAVNGAAKAPAVATLDCSRAESLIGASDARGAQSDVVLTAAGKALPVAPAVTLADLNLSTDGGPAPTRDAAAPGAI